ncbi:MAG: molybdate ABC transporter substrate-binding protein, partial [Nisaea sp.]|nr:molybdate ABC transporter substrate-binding protein [Nisaea sp.]
PRARVLAVLPETTHPPIRYPLLRLTDKPATRAAEAFLRGPAAAAVFARHGFRRAP